MIASVREGVEDASASPTAPPAALAPGSPATKTNRPDLPLPADERVVLIGQAPRDNYPDYPLFPWPRGCTGHRLSQLAGVSPFRYLRKFIRLNVFYKAPGKSGAFPMTLAREYAAEIAPYLTHRTVVFVSLSVADAFGWRNAPLMKWTPVDLGHGTVWCAVVPHPSGRNRWYNSARNKAQAEEFMRSAAEMSPTMSAPWPSTRP